MVVVSYLPRLTGGKCGDDYYSTVKIMHTVDFKVVEWKQILMTADLIAKLRK